MLKKGLSVFPLFLSIALFTGCSLFTSHYDSTRHENFTKLKATHVQFIEDWSKDSGKEWNENLVTSYCINGDLAFRQAFEYAKSLDKSDKTGQKAVDILWSEFKANCALSLKKKKLFSSVFKKNILPTIEQNYDYAIQGELSRVQ